VHGRTDLLVQVRNFIAENLSRQPISLGMTILVADYVDRGPEPKSVIDYLASDQFFPTPTIALRGNHDEVLLAFLADPRTGDL
jgi:Calcineurin-like phosphoesterase